MADAGLTAAIPAVIYAAKSTDDRHGSIPTQIEDCQAAVKREGRMPYGEPQMDEGFSGYKRSRGPGLEEAKRLAVAGASEHGEAELWVQHSDRLARGDGLTADHLAEIFFAMRKVRVRLRSVQDDSNLEDVIRVALIGERSHEDSKRKSGAVTSGKDRQMKAGHRLGGPVPDGLRLFVERDAADRVTSRRYERDPDRAPIIQEAFRLSEQGMGDAPVARALNTAGHRTKNGHTFNRRRVQDLLTNQTYAGRVVRHRDTTREEVAPATNVEPLIDPDRFDAIRAKRAPRDLGRGRHERRGQPPKLFALVRGLGMCDRCGGKLRPQASHYKRKDGTRARKYICEHYAEGMCDQPPIDAEHVDTAIVAYLDSLFIDVAEWERRDDAVTESWRAGTERTLEQARRRLAKLARREPLVQDRWTEAMEAGDRRKEDAAFEALDDLRRERDATEAKVQELQEALTAPVGSTTVDDKLDLHAELARGLRGLSTDRMGELSERLHEVFDHFVLDTVEKGVVVFAGVLREDTVERYGSDKLVLHEWDRPERVIEVRTPSSVPLVVAVTGDETVRDSALSPAEHYGAWRADPDQYLPNTHS